MPGQIDLLGDQTLCPISWTERAGLVVEGVLW